MKETDEEFFKEMLLDAEADHDVTYTKTDSISSES
jgi:hypothetical protein